MVAKIDLISEASHKHAGEVTALAFDGDHLYSGSADGVINMWSKDLQFNREIPVHKDFAVLALVANSHKQLYSCGRDGSLRYFRRPWSHDNNDILLQTVQDDVTALYIANDVLFSGDDKGIVTKWYHNQVGAQYNVAEEVKSMAVEENNLYTVRETDVQITDITPHMMSQVTKGVIPGRAPLILFGTQKPFIPDSVPMGRRASYVPEIIKTKKYVVSATRDGKGIVVSNNGTFKVLATKENAHTMIINVMCELDDFLITAGFDGKVKKWKDLETKPVLVEEIDTGKCINALIAGPEQSSSVFVGDSDGFVKRLKFSA
ncbi:uncharacterized protein LOC129569544 [Sitodiplosis mosellana]|uniref:uncharacterized protein LOC129569544 n=1 Tax=Sitodiplosis mosellana TaxID=263140 RepID=UPI0024448537|nr:uncharacterized protein LOC129569544 [Sitodiplosis mosellana]